MLPLWKYGPCLGDLPQRFRPELASQIHGLQDALELHGAGRPIVAVLATTIEVVHEAHHVIVAALVVRHRLLDGGVVELLVGERLGLVARAAACLADEQLEAALGARRQRAEVALDISIERRVAADEATLVSLKRLSDIGHDGVHDLAIFGPHHFPRLIGIARARLGLAARREARGIRGICGERRIEDAGLRAEQRIVLVAIVVVNHVRDGQAVAIHVLGLGCVRPPASKTDPARHPNRPTRNKRY